MYSFRHECGVRRCHGARLAPGRLHPHRAWQTFDRALSEIVPWDGWSGTSGRPTLKVMTVWSMLEECISQLDEPFRRSEIIGWFRRHHPEVNESTLAAHIQAATANATNRARNNPL